MNTKTVLFVEDDEHTRLLYEMVMKRFLPNYTVYVAESAEVALTILEKTKIDVIATDVNLAGMSGRCLFINTKEKHVNNPGFPMPRFIFCSGVERILDNIVDKIQGYEYLTLTKPFHLEDLAKAIKSFENTLK